ncbi:MAG: carboxypeptidase regulatory-like domain-containing protein [Planctomycetota bacterium]
MARRRPRRRRFAALAALLLLFLWGLNPFMAGVLPGGGRLPDLPERTAEPGTIDILVVRASDRQPVEGATLRLRDLHGKEHEGRTDAAGRAVFGGLSSVPMLVEARGEGGLARVWGKPGEALNLELEAPPMRRGRVRDAQGNARPGEVHLLDVDANVLARTQTDENGEYELPDLPDGYAVCAWPDEGAASSSIDGDVVISDGEMREARGGDGVIDVYAMVPDSKEDRMVPLRVRWPIRETRGRGRLPQSVQAWWYDGPYPMPIEHLGHHRFPMRQAHGVVTDGEGRPIAGAAVVQDRMTEDLQRIRPNPFRTRRTTDEAGRFDCGTGSQGRFEITVSAPGFATTRFAYANKPMEARLTAGFHIGGRVIDENDEPLRGVEIVALPGPDPDIRFARLRTVTTDDGRFFLDGLGGEYARIVVRKRGYGKKILDRVPPRGESTIRLTKE